MNVAIIVIGDELLIGQVTDTNSGFIARHIAPYGWQVVNVQVVADDADCISRAMDRAFALAPVVLTTGGLGPTKDDITKGVMCRYFGGELIEDSEVLDNVKNIFKKRGLKLNDLTRSQAMVPSSCKVIQNRVGTAPIMWFNHVHPNGASQVLVSMPGVPFETAEMFTSEVFPRLRAFFPSDLDVEHRTMVVADISESDLATRLEGFEAQLPQGFHLAYLPKPGIIRLRLDAMGNDRSVILPMLDEQWAKLTEEVGDNLLWNGDAEPAEILLKELDKRALTVATAESCTGGNIAHLITLVPGSSSAMLGGVVSYANTVKTHVLGVNADVINSLGAVSIPVAEQMAEGVRGITHADIAMSTSGIAGPGGAVPGKPVGTVCIAVATPWGTISGEYHFPGSRSRVIDRATQTALILAIRQLQKH
ncbi:MAG: CinA family nicotinamide mononucleotide deamidase-related protein [Paramuribaculum sp.]|nr:CinA family nicotinamide mononucleotide deamidase-related protein [Paramuribaculum sp.]